MSDGLGWLRDDLRAMREDMQTTRETMARIEARLDAHEKSSASHRAVVQDIDNRVRRIEHDRSKVLGFIAATGLGSSALGAAIIRMLNGGTP